MDYSNLISVVATISALLEEQQKEIEHLKELSDANAQQYTRSSHREYELMQTISNLNTDLKNEQMRVDVKLAKDNPVLIKIATDALLRRGEENCRKVGETTLGPIQLTDANSFIGAIKYVREHTEWGLKDAKDFVENFVWSLHSPCVDKDDRVPIEIATAFMKAEGEDKCKSNFIHTCKAVRSITGWGLKDSKDFVQDFKWETDKNMHDSHANGG